MNIEKLNTTISIIHQASQLIAIPGKDLAPCREDDSHTAFEFSWTRKQFVGRKIAGEPSVRVALDIETLELSILNLRLEKLSGFTLINKTKEEGYEYLKQNLKKYGVNTSSLSPDIPYHLPALETSAENRFYAPDSLSATLHTRLRAFSKTLLQSLSRVFENTSEILVWPHHFDTGMIIYLGGDKNNYKATIGIGFNIKDNISEEPYLYVNHWSDNKINYPGQLPSLIFGEWHSGDWTGAIMKLREFVSESGEINEEKAAHFMSDSIEKSLNLIA